MKLILSWLRWAFTISFHTIFPAFTIGLAAWLTVVEAQQFATGRPACRQIFEFWREIFGMAFRVGVVSGIVIAFQFGTSRSELSRMSGQGPLLRRVRLGGQLFRDPAVWPRDGRIQRRAFRLLDQVQQQLKAGVTGFRKPQQISQT